MNSGYLLFRKYSVSLQREKQYGHNLIIIDTLNTMLKLIKSFIDSLSRTQKQLSLLLLGGFFGIGLLFLYLLRAHSYLGNDPSACVNCHIMTPYYATWFHSSHSRNATCNDCHVPHENIARKYAFKGMDGMKHVGMFVTKMERQAPRIGDSGAQVVMNNCIRCHTELNTTLANTGKVDYMMTQVGQGKVCWDCHRQVPHGGSSSLSATPDAKVPLPESPVPGWLLKAMGMK